jgi:acetyltransferase-like isoleucine patch superfamily enzyme
MAVAFRVSCTAVSIVVVETAVCGLAALPVVAAWSLLDPGALSSPIQLAFYSVLAVPSYVAFALALMIVSPLATWLTRARTPRDVELCLADCDWPLMSWARYVVAIHIVRVLAGSLFRGSPVWTAYLRLNGAHMGRRVYVNTLAISDHNLLEFGDDVVIGGDVHISGHSVEAGMLKTAPVRLGRGVTIGLGSVVNIGVDAGADCQVGALSLVPKHTRLENGGVYVGVPVRRLDASPHDLAEGHDRFPVHGAGR